MFYVHDSSGGPGDQTIAPEIAAMVKKGVFTWINEGRALTSTTHIDNLVCAAKLVLKNGCPGQAYFVTDGESNSFRGFLTQLMGA